MKESKIAVDKAIIILLLIYQSIKCICGKKLQSKFKCMNLPSSDLYKDSEPKLMSCFGLQVMQLQATHKVHRVFIVEGDLHPIGIITCTDVIKKLMDQ